MEELGPPRKDQLSLSGPENRLFSESPEVTINDYIRIFSRRRWSILAIWLSVVLIAIIYNFVATKYYSSRASIIIRVGMPSSILKSTEINFPNFYAMKGDFDTKISIITTRPILLEAAKRLVEKGYFRPENFDQLSEEDKQNLYRNIAGGLTGKVNARVVEKTNLVYIFATDTDPKKAAAIANAMAEAMVSYNGLEQEILALNSLKFLDQQLEESRQRVSEAERKLFEYKQKNQIFETQIDKNQLAEQRGSLSVELRNLDTQIKMIYAQMETLHNLLARKDYSRYTPPAIYSSPVPVQANLASGQAANLYESESGGDPVLLSLNQQLIAAEINHDLLSKKYKEEHPQVIEAKNQIEILRAKFEEELNKNITSLELRNNLLLSKQAKLNADMEVLNQKVVEITSKDAEYIVLEREANSARELLNSLLAAVKEANIEANGSFKDTIFIHEYARPNLSPIKPNRLFNLLIAAFLGLFFGLAQAILSGMMDRSLRSPEDVEFHTRLPVLSLLPHLTETYAKDHYPIVVIDQPRSLYSEGVLHLRANLRMLFSNYGIKSLVLTSCSPKEGKSIVTANLGVSMAQEGIRTLVIDADLRRPIQHKFFGLEREKGLTRALIDLFQNPDWKSQLAELTFGDLNLLIKLQKLSGLVTIHFNSKYPLRLLYQNGQILAGNLREWRISGQTNLEDITPEELRLEFSESTGHHQILPALKKEEIEGFFSEFPILIQPIYFSYKLFENYTHPGAVDGLRVMPSGPIPSNPGEILGSVHFREIINMLRPNFDLILFDSAPCWPLSDVSMLSQVADGIIFLVRANRVSRDILSKNIQMLKMLNFRIAGAVFNDLDLKKEKYYYGGYYHYHYYYYYYYSYGYGGYGTEEKEEG